MFLHVCNELQVALFDLQLNLIDFKKTKRTYYQKSEKLRVKRFSEVVNRFKNAKKR